MNKAVSDIRKKYDSDNRKKLIILAIGIAAVIIMGIYFVTLGVADTDVPQVIHAIKAWIRGSLNSGLSEENKAYKIIVLMRLPRIAMAIVAGIGLAVSGTAMQAVTRNPLVSPFTMGVSSASGIRTSMCIVFGTGAFLKARSE